MYICMYVCMHATKTSLCSIHDYCLHLCKQVTRAGMDLCGYKPTLDLGLCMHARNCYVLLLLSIFAAYFGEFITQE